MNADQFREFGKATMDFIVDYLENTRERNVLPSVQPGYMRDLIPDEMPARSEDWREIFADVDRVLMPGITHWQSPRLNAYYPTTTSYPCIVGEMLTSGLGLMSFSWVSSPACTELEVIVMDWLAKFLNLPEHFLNSHDGPGGGAMQGSASEAILISILTARETMVRTKRETFPFCDEIETRSKLVAYTSDQANSCVEKDGMLASIPIKLLRTKRDLQLTGEILEEAIREDLREDRIPTICIATLGTTGMCIYDDIPSIAAVCKKYGVWLHVDAAYAGALLCLPEHQERLSKGLDLVDSFNLNLDKTMLVTFESGLLWMRDTSLLVDSFAIERQYLQHKVENHTTAPDFRNWQIPLGRRFRALKTWFTLRAYGVEGMRCHIRRYIRLAKYFEQKVSSDDRFELVMPAEYGLNCFRLRGGDSLTSELCERLTKNKKMYVHTDRNNEQLYIRFVVGGFDPEEKDMDFAWTEITQQADAVLEAHLELIASESQRAEKIQSENVDKVLTHIFDELNLNGLE